MIRWPQSLLKLSFLVAFLLIVIPSSVQAQGQPARMHGEVIDPTGAVIPNADITIKNSATGQTTKAKSDGVGSYSLKDLPAGKYTVEVSEKGFSKYNKEVDLAAGQDLRMNLVLQVQVDEQIVDVEGEAARVSTNPDQNASTLVISGKDLDALSDDPDELQSELQALAGPSAGPNGGQIYIDGFTGGQLPPKSSIREIRINQNPFSAQYDRMGFGRIEILTKPGTDKVHGQVLLNDNHSFLDSQNPFAALKPDFSTQMYNASIGGPISKKASYLVSMERRAINDVSVISDQLAVGAANAVPGFDCGLTLPCSVPNPHMRTNISPRVDYQLTPNNTLTARYQYVHDTQDNAGVGQLVLPTYAFNSTSTEHTVQISDTQVIGARAINETRFEWQRASSNQNALNSGPAIIVQDFVTAGGNPVGISSSDSDHYELQNYTSINRGTHFMRFGGRLRLTSLSNSTPQNFNGTYIFVSKDAFLAGQPSQYNVTTGQPEVSNTFVDVGLYAEDDWRLRPNMTLSYGLRYETQNEINDHADWAPRIGFAWGIGGKKNAAPKTVLRTGFGIFYDRIPQNVIVNTLQKNGVLQQTFSVNAQQDPALLASFFPNKIPVSSLQAETGTTVYELSNGLRTPYTVQAAASLERQVTKKATATLTYIHSRGIHQLVQINANTPLIPLDPSSRPNPALGNIFQYTSDADFKQNQMIANVNVRASQKLTIFSYYSLSFANSDTGGANSVASNSQNISADYGRASFDVRSRVFFGGTFGLPKGFRVSPFLLFFSGAPFNITTGLDNNGDFVFNDRPALDAGIPGHIVVSQPGFPAFDITPSPGQPLIPINFADGPSQFTFNLRLSRTFGIGPKIETPAGNQPQGGQGDHQHGPVMRGGGGPGGGHGPGGPGGMGGGPFGGERSNQKYSLTFSANARNLFNHVNPGLPIGNLSSQLFDQSTGLAGGPFNSQSANRRIDLQVMFAF